LHYLHSLNELKHNSISNFQGTLKLQNYTKQVVTYTVLLGDKIICETP